MNYQRIYDLISRAKNIPVEWRVFSRTGIWPIIKVYVEEHHIIPLCMHGSDTTENKILLTGEEHYLAHQLLAKINPKDWRIVNAAQMMTIDANGNRSNNKLYGWIKEMMSKAIKGKTNVERFGEEKAKEISAAISVSKKGKPSPKKGTTYTEEQYETMMKQRDGKPGNFKGKKHSEETKAQIKKSNTGKSKSEEHRRNLLRTYQIENNGFIEILIGMDALIEKFSLSFSTIAQGIHKRGGIMKNGIFYEITNIKKIKNFQTN